MRAYAAYAVRLVRNWWVFYRGTHRVPSASRHLTSRRGN